MHSPEPQAEHRWLHQLLGQWRIESEIRIHPDQPAIKTTGREVVRSLGKLWVICEGTSDSPDDGGCDSMMTLGYDPQRKHFVGSYIVSAMAHFWPYVGSLDPSANTLTLDSEGPSFLNEGSICRYQDVIHVITHDHRTLVGHVQNADGHWQPFMTSHYYRKR